MNSRVCSHCGIPFRVRSERVAGPAFCCAGCAVAATLLAGTPGEPGHARKGLVRLGLAAFFAADIMVLTLFLYSVGPSDRSTPIAAVALVRALLLCFSIPVFVLLAPPFLNGMMRDLRRARLSMDSLISLGSGAAFGFSCASVVRGSGEVYFDTAAMVLLFVTAGRLIEAHARVRGRDGLRLLLEAQVAKARVLRNGAWTAVDSREVQPGETIRVLAGERIPVDGVIREGSASVNASPVTGEAVPSGKMPGDPVFAGSVCLDGMLEVSCTAASGDSLLARIVAAVEQARMAPARSERLADRMAAVLTPATLALAAAALAVHWHAGVEHAVLTGLSVLVVACPCALGIAVPLVYVMALSGAARRGVLIRSAEAWEQLAGIDTIAFDKTGTLTTGAIGVTRVVPLDGSTTEQVIAAAAAAAQCSTHPVARAASRLAAGAPEPVSSAEELPGRGVRVRTRGGRTILLGQPRWVAAETGEPEPAVAGEGGVALCAAQGRIAGALVLGDAPAPGVLQAVAECRALGLHMAVLSGDRETAVREIAAGFGIAEARGGLFPEEKARRIREMQRAGRRIAMLGDGINDAPAMAAADVGVAVSNGVDVAREVAQVALVSGGAARIPELLRAARSTRRAARANFVCTILYNSAALSMAAAGWLRPLWAAALMLLSSILVVFHSMRAASHLPWRHAGLH